MILYVPKTYTKYLYTVIYWSLIKSWSLCHYYFPHQDTFYCISQATPINAWVRTLSAVLTESTERAVVERFMTYVSKYIFKTLLCVYICVYKYTHTYIRTVISHTHTWVCMRVCMEVRGWHQVSSFIFIKCTYIHTYRVFMEARGCYQIPSFIIYLY